MKKGHTLFMLSLCLFLTACATGGNESSEDTYIVDSSEWIDESSSEDLSDRIIITINKEEIVDFDDYDSLAAADQQKVAYEYLLQALGAFLGEKKEVDSFLEERGYKKPETYDFTVVIEELREENPRQELNDILIGLTNEVMKVKEN